MLKLGLHVLVVSFSKVWRIFRLILASHTPHTLSLAHASDNSRISGEKQGIAITRELGRAWHAFILQSPHRMTFFDPAEEKEKQKNSAPDSGVDCSHLRTGQSPTRAALTSQQPKHGSKEFK